MTSARKVIDWHGQQADDLAREFVGLAKGRYAIVLESEVDDSGLTAEEEAELREAIAEGERGEAVPAQQVVAEMRALIERGR